MISNLHGWSQPGVIVTDRDPAGGPTTGRSPGESAFSRRVTKRLCRSIVGRLDAFEKEIVSPANRTFCRLRGTILFAELVELPTDVPKQRCVHKGEKP
jgi:hypothetical protein